MYTIGYLIEEFDTMVINLMYCVICMNYSEERKSILISNKLSDRDIFDCENFGLPICLSCAEKYDKQDVGKYTKTQILKNLLELVGKYPYQIYKKVTKNDKK